MTYSEFKQKQQKEFEAFPMVFAFNQKQFDEGLKKLNAEPKDVYKFFGGGFYRKSDSEKLKTLLDKMDKDKQEFLADDNNLTNAIEYELGNHEYCITFDESSALAAVGVKLDNDRVKTCFVNARNKYLDYCRANEII